MRDCKSAQRGEGNKGISDQSGRIDSDLVSGPSDGFRSFLTWW